MPLHHLGSLRFFAASNDADREPGMPVVRTRQLYSDMLHTSTATGAQKFPLAASARIILSSIRSKTVRRRRAFSASNSFKRYCGCRPYCKRFLPRMRCDRMQTPVRSSTAALLKPLADMVISRSDPNPFSKLNSSPPLTGFPNPDLFDHFAHMGR